MTPDEVRRTCIAVLREYGLIDPKAEARRRKALVAEFQHNGHESARAAELRAELTGPVAGILGALQRRKAALGTEGPAPQSSVPGSLRLPVRGDRKSVDLLPELRRWQAAYQTLDVVAELVAFCAYVATDPGQLAPEDPPAAIRYRLDQAVRRRAQEARVERTEASERLKLAAAELREAAVTTEDEGDLMRLARRLALEAGVPAGEIDHLTTGA